ncbi:UPF0481 protein [Vitis vinifera]|uniref:UPF0481 protein n=1 Tax=Vitis vinifera TaxID=29760 RepID=A0A438HF82_VITVI|nr:UPF0481 protein [Vitis vinifera]
MGMMGSSRRWRKEKMGQGGDPIPWKSRGTLERKKAANQVGNSAQTGLEPEQHGIDIVEISPRVKNWIESLKKAAESSQSQSQWPRIPMVPQLLRGTQDFKKLYEPSVISIGPYHHGKRHLYQGEMIKPRYVQKFLDDSNQDIEALYKKIVSNIEALRKCYDRSSTTEYDDEALAWMMLLDGCFLLDFICRVVTGKWSELHGFNVKDHFINFKDQDLFLLENQLPFGVLKLIFEEAKFHGVLTVEKMVEIFITRNNGIHLEPEDKEPSHLLDLLRSAELGSPWKKGKQQGIWQSEKKGKSSSSGGGDGKQRGIWKSFRHIKELKAAGIYLKPSRTSFLTDISFESYFFYGYLKLPPITIDDFTKTKFLNMVAYEMCRDATDDNAVTSYICFLDELIDHADDVKELRSKHILHNLLGSDEDVAKIFNEIANRLVDPGIYDPVKARIQKIYDRRVNSWIAEAFHDHFRSPWTSMALVAAVLILILTGVQTYYAHPEK